MSLQLEVSPETYAALTRQAAEVGTSPEAFAARVLERQYGPRTTVEPALVGVMPPRRKKEEALDFGGSD